MARQQEFSNIGSKQLLQNWNFNHIFIYLWKPNRTTVLLIAINNKNIGWKFQCDIVKKDYTELTKIYPNKVNEFVRKIANFPSYAKWGRTPLLLFNGGCTNGLKSLDPFFLKFQNNISKNSFKLKIESIYAFFNVNNTFKLYIIF